MEREWIRIEDALPEDGERVIISTDMGFVGEAYRNQKGEWFRAGIGMTKLLLGKTVAWMPLPEQMKR